MIKLILYDLCEFSLEAACFCWKNNVPQFNVFLYLQVVECINDIPIKKAMQLEVVDKMCVSAMKVAKVQEVVGGRLRLHYLDSKVGCHSSQLSFFFFWIF